jgi:nucleotide-binding universal stress UspA family protein
LSEFAELHVVHAWQLAYESFLRSPNSGTSNIEIDVMKQEEKKKHRRWLEDLMDKYCARQGEETTNYLKPQLHLINGDASRVVPELSDKLCAELVVMGTVGRAGVPGLLTGNTAENILDQIDCSVLTVKPAGFISPVTLEN